MELWQLVLIMWGISFSIVVLVVLFVAWRQIKLRWQVILGKRRDRGLVIEIKTNRSIREHFVKFTKDTLEIGERIYNIKPEHIFMSDDWGCKAVVVSEALKGSLRPESVGEFDGLDSETITNLIKRAKSAGQHEALDFIQKVSKMAPLILLGLGAALAIQIFLSIQILITVKGGTLI